MSQRTVRVGPLLFSVWRWGFFIHGIGRLRGKVWIGPDRPWIRQAVAAYFPDGDDAAKEL